MPKYFCNRQRGRRCGGGGVREVINRSRRVEGGCVCSAGRKACMVLFLARFEVLHLADTHHRVVSGVE